MNKFKPSRLVGLSTLALAALGFTSSQVIANDYSSISSLPVITDDCGGEGCADRRDMTLEAVYSDAKCSSTRRNQRRPCC